MRGSNRCSEKKRIAAPQWVDCTLCPEASPQRARHQAVGSRRQQAEAHWAHWRHKGADALLRNDSAVGAAAANCPQKVRVRGCSCLNNVAFPCHQGHSHHVVAG